MQGVLTSLWPVLAWISLGYLLRRVGAVGALGVRRLTDFTFWALIPLYLLLTMSRVQWAEVRMLPVLAYFMAAFVVIAAVLWRQGLTRRAAVWGLAATFSNNVMIGLPLVTLTFGERGLATMMSLLVVHSLVLLTAATCLLELASARDPAHGVKVSLGKALGGAAVKTFVHPVPLPIIVGLLWASSGAGWFSGVDVFYAGLQAIFAPAALMLVGMSLGGGVERAHWRGATSLAATKNLVFPVLVLAACWLLGETGVPAATMVLAAALPIGANVMLFAQRYEAEPELVSAAISLSSVASLLSVSTVVAILR